MNWRDKFNRPMELDSPEYKLALAIKALQQKIKLGIIDKQKATEIMTELVGREEKKANKELLPKAVKIAKKMGQ